LSILLPALFIEDSTKYLIFFVAIIAIIAIARVARGGKAEESYQQPQADDSTQETTVEPETEIVDESDEEGDDLHPEVRYGDIVVRSIFFKSFDILKGPEDPECFLDELHVDCVNASDGYAFKMSFTVGTPKGVAQMLAEEKFAIMRLPDFFVVSRYDLKLIRDTVMGESTGEGVKLQTASAPGEGEQ